MLPNAIIALTMVLATTSTSTGENVCPGDPGEVVVVKAPEDVNDYLNCFKDIFQESLNVSRKCSEDMEKLTNETKGQLDEQQIIITTLKDDIQQMVSRDAGETLSQQKRIIFTLASKLESVTSLVKDQSNQLAESQRRNVQLTEGMNELNNKVALLNNLLEASNSCKQQDKVKKLVQGFDKLAFASSLNKGLGNLLDSNTVASSQLQKVLQMNKTPLWSIGIYGYVDLALLLLSGGMPVDKVIDRNGNHMLHAAAYGGHLQLARLLLFHGADLDAKRSRDGYTPLMMAVDKGHLLDMVKYLVRVGADVSITQGNGKTALDLARSGKYTAVSKFLESL